MNHPHHRPPHHGHDEPENPAPGLPPIDPDDGVAPMPTPLDPDEDPGTPPI